MKVRPNAPCPCGSTHKFKKCCRPLLMGAKAPSPEALMRSRYTAYATGNVRYILHTTHPQGPHFRHDVEQWSAEVQAFSQGTSFDGLTVHTTRTVGDQGWVHFEVALTRHGEDQSFAENSAFRRLDGQWLYFSGEPRPRTSPA